MVGASAVEDQTASPRPGGLALDPEDHVLSKVYGQVKRPTLSEWHQHVESSNDELSKNGRLPCITASRLSHNETLCIRSDGEDVSCPRSQ